jgi:hypothetical protein
MSRMFASGANLGLHDTGLAGVPLKLEHAPTPLKQPGDPVEWSSGTGVLQDAKRGRVLAILPAGESLRAAIAAAGRKVQRVHAQDVAGSDRYVVEVQTKRGPAYHAPLVKTVAEEARPCRGR